MKKFIRNNKAICFMLLIIIACFIMIVALLFKYFYFGSGGSKYGNRLDGIETVEITDNKKEEVVNFIKESKGVEDATVTVTGKIIYIRIVLAAGTNIDAAKAAAVKTIDKFSDEEKAFYDLHYTLVCAKSEKDEGFTIMGSKNINGTNLIWNNNNATTSETEN